jgi:hypothetical protein
MKAVTSFEPLTSSAHDRISSTDALLQLGRSCNGDQVDCSSTGNFQNAIAVSVVPQ